MGRPVGRPVANFLIFGPEMTELMRGFPVESIKSVQSRGGNDSPMNGPMNSIGQRKMEHPINLNGIKSFNQVGRDGATT